MGTLGKDALQIARMAQDVHIAEKAGLRKRLETHPILGAMLYMENQMSLQLIQS